MEKSLHLSQSLPYHFCIISKFQFSSVARLYLTLCDPRDCSTPGFPVHHQHRSLFKLMSTESVMPSNPLILCHSLLLLTSIFPASGSFLVSQCFISGGPGIGISASASVLPMNIQDWFPLGGTGWISLQSKGLPSLLQHHSAKASILQQSAFFTVQLLHTYMTTEKP